MSAQPAASSSDEAILCNSCLIVHVLPVPATNDAKRRANELINERLHEEEEGAMLTCFGTNQGWLDA